MPICRLVTCRYADLSHADMQTCHMPICRLVTCRYADSSHADMQTCHMPICKTCEMIFYFLGHYFGASHWIRWLTFSPQPSHLCRLLTLYSGFVRLKKNSYGCPEKLQTVKMPFSRGPYFFRFIHSMFIRIKFFTSSARLRSLGLIFRFLRACAIKGFDRQLQK